MAEQGPAADGQGGARRLILHLGVQKTGTTSLQRFLEANAAGLADILILRTPRDAAVMRPLGRACIAYSLGPEKDLAARLRVAFEDVLGTLPAGPQTVLISHENMAGAMPGNGGETRLFPALPRIVRLLDEVAREHGFSAEFAFYTRRMTMWKPSVWAQAIRTDGYCGTRAEFDQATAALPGWGDLERRLADVAGPGRLHRLRLEDETDPHRPGRQLLALAGVPAERQASLTPIAAPAMERLSEASTEFLRRLNKLSLAPHAQQKVVDLVSRAQDLFAADGPPKGTL